MSLQYKTYCHIIGRKIIINNENTTKKVSFEPNKNKNICSQALKVCDGNCNGCNLL